MIEPEIGRTKDVDVFHRLSSQLMNKPPAAPEVWLLPRQIGRVREWWEEKLIPAFAVLLATALVQQVSTASLLIAMLELIVLLSTGALFVSLLNDWTDRDEDRRSGKANSFETHPKLGALLLILSVATGAAWLWWLSSHPLAAAIYLLGWLAYAAYSLPPLRLKVRGLPGLLCDATGAHVVPALLAVTLVSGVDSLDWPWLLAVAVWSFAWGVRGIVSHQRADQAHDREAGVQTFVVRHGAFRSQWWCRRIVFPVECAALLAILVQLPGSAALVALSLALLFQVAKAARFGLRPVLTSADPRALPLLGDYYFVFMPLALILETALSEPSGAWLLLVYLTLFPRHPLAVVRDAVRLQFEVLR